MSQKYESFDLVRTGKPTRDHQRIGRDELGFKFIYEVEQDKPTSSSHYWTHFLYQNLNVTADLSNSRTNTVIFTAALGRAQDVSGSSGSASASDSNESSNSAQGNSIENHQIPSRGPVLAIAITGKKGVVQSLDKKATNVDEIDNKNTKNTFQYLGQFVLGHNMEAGYVRIAKGRAADKLAKTLQSGALRVVREAIRDPETDVTQESGCIEIVHKVQEASISSMVGETAIGFGDNCERQSISKLKIRTLVDVTDKIQAKLQVKNQHELPHQLQSVARNVEYFAQRLSRHADRNPALQMAVQSQPLEVKLKYSPLQQLQKSSRRFADSVEYQRHSQNRNQQKSQSRFRGSSSESSEW
jgi:hypothetical protein